MMQYPLDMSTQNLRKSDGKLSGRGKANLALKHRSCLHAQLGVGRSSHLGSSGCKRD